MQDPITQSMSFLKWMPIILILIAIVGGTLAVLIRINAAALMKRKQKQLQKLERSLTLPALRDDNLADESHPNKSQRPKQG
jgi:hypothetical protein